MPKFRKSIYGSDHLLLQKWLVDKRKQQNLTQRQLAARLGVVRSLVGKVEKGERRLDVIEFATYCAALQVTPTEFLFLLERQQRHTGSLHPG